MPTDKKRFKEAWRQVVELIEDEDFGSDISGPEYDEQCSDIKSTLEELGLTDIDKSVFDELCDYVSSAAREFYFAEYAGNAPGSRSSHLNMSKVHSSCAKNRVRLLCGVPEKGAREAKEIDEWLKSIGPRQKDVEYPEYTETGKAFAREMSVQFKISTSLASTLVSIAGGRYGFRAGRSKNEDSRWNRVHVEYAGVRCYDARKKAK